MSLKDRFNLPTEEKISTNTKPLFVDTQNVLLEKILRENDNILICCPIGIATYNAINFLCSKIPTNKRLVGIGSNLLLNPSELIKFEPDTKNSSKELIKTALSLNPDKIILQDFDGIEAVDIFKLINAEIKNVISAVQAKTPQKALQQIELNLYMNGISIPEKMMKQMLCDFIDKIIMVEKINNTQSDLIITKIYELKSYTNEYKIAEITNNSSSLSISPKETTTIDNNCSTTSFNAPKNILASKLKKKKINK